MIQQSKYNYASDVGYYLLWLIIIFVGITFYSIFKSEPFIDLILPSLAFVWGINDLIMPKENLIFSSDIKKHFLKERFKSLRLLIVHATLSLILAWITYRFFGDENLTALRLGLFGVGGILVSIGIFRQIKANR